MRPSIGGPFRLMDHEGREVSDETYRGDYVLIFFGFTNCRVVCPRALTKLTAVLDSLGPLAGLGIVLHPTFLVSEHLRQGRLIRLLPDYHTAEVDVMVVYPSRRHVSAKVRVMVDFLVEAFRGKPPWD